MRWKEIAPMHVFLSPKCAIKKKEKKKEGTNGTFKKLSLSQCGIPLKIQGQWAAYSLVFGASAQQFVMHWILANTVLCFVEKATTLILWTNGTAVFSLTF